jgi:hypothetical protein
LPTYHVVYRFPLVSHFHSCSLSEREASLTHLRSYSLRSQIFFLWREAVFFAVREELLLLLQRET